MIMIRLKLWGQADLLLHSSWQGFQNTVHSTDFAKGLKKLSCQKESWNILIISLYSIYIVSTYNTAGLSNMT